MPGAVSNHGDDTKIIHLHIPKTGGQSLNGLLDRSYRQVDHCKTRLSDVLTSEAWKEWCEKIQNTPEEKRGHYGLFKGHMYFGVHELLKSPCKYITFLRDPVERCISHYLMLTRDKIIDPGQRIDPSRPDWNLSSYPAFHRTLDNYQTRILAGTDPNMPFGQCNESHLQTALANLEQHFAFVGLTEHFDLSLALLRRTCNWRWCFYIPINIKPKAQASIEPEVISALRKLNRFDQVIHQRAEEKIKEMANHYGLNLRLEHFLFRRGNALHRRYTGVRRAIQRKLGLKSSRPAGHLADMQTSSNEPCA